MSDDVYKITELAEAFGTELAVYVEAPGDVALLLITAVRRWAQLKGDNEDGDLVLSVKAGFDVGLGDLRDQ